MVKKGYREFRSQQKGEECRRIDIPHLSSIRDMWVHDVRCMDIARFGESPMLRGHIFRSRYT
jgi:hypothetical protein